MLHQEIVNQREQLASQQSHIRQLQEETAAYRMSAERSEARACIAENKHMQAAQERDAAGMIMLSPYDTCSRCALARTDL